MTNRCVKEPVDFIDVFQILPRHFSASDCHLQGVVDALLATRATGDGNHLPKNVGVKFETHQ
jgi:2C-methyl-D-erythritol 2,4-cyclodiphosphate synthase